MTESLKIVYVSFSNVSSVGTSGILYFIKVKIFVYFYSLKIKNKVCVFKKSKDNKSQKQIQSSL